MHIGKRINQVVRQKGVSITWLAKKIHCDRRNIYDIFQRECIDTILLQRISMALEYDFFKDLSDDTFSKDNV